VSLRIFQVAVHRIEQSPSRFCRFHMVVTDHFGNDLLLPRKMLLTLGDVPPRHLQIGFAHARIMAACIFFSSGSASTSARQLIEWIAIYFANLQRSKPAGAHGLLPKRGGRHWLVWLALPLGLPSQDAPAKRLAASCA
jgi:hypothetical protein